MTRMRREPSVHDRLARPHREPPERDRHAFGLERRIDQVMVADRGAAGRDQDRRRRRGGGCRRGVDRVGGDAEVDGSAPSARASARSA